VWSVQARVNALLYIGNTIFFCDAVDFFIKSRCCFVRIICQCSGGYIFAGSQRLADFVYIFCYTFWRNNRKTYIPYIRTPKKTSENINNLKTLLGFHPYPRSSGDYKNSPSPESLLAEPKQTVKGYSAVKRHASHPSTGCLRLLL
ncbi:MAG: hypothetical protein IIV26_02565, partial [Peptococcaceae bacterium]|nr:hypothetical protein [Peptococcaceae bacterium]